MGELRELWRSIPPKGRQVIHVLWPSWVGAVAILAAMPVELTTRPDIWPAWSMDVFGLCFELISVWRLRPMLKELLSASPGAP